MILKNAKPLIISSDLIIFLELTRINGPKVLYLDRELFELY